MADKSYLERLYDKVLEQIDVQIEAVARGLELDNPRPFGAHKLTRQEQREYFASLPPEKQLEIWGQLTPEEQQELIGNG